LVGDELIEIGIGESAARSPLAVAERDIAQRAGGDVLVERPDRDPELGRGLGARAQAIGRARAGQSFCLENLRPCGGWHLGEKVFDRARATGADWHRKKILILIGTGHRRRSEASEIKSFRPAVRTGGSARI
jgi:hypothetical protein